MNRTDLAQKLKSETSIQLSDAKYIIDYLCEQIVNELVAGNNVNITNFGTFKPYTRKATYRKMPNGDPIEIKAKRCLNFTPSPIVLDKLN